MLSNMMKAYVGIALAVVFIGLVPDELPEFWLEQVFMISNFGVGVFFLFYAVAHVWKAWRGS